MTGADVFAESAFLLTCQDFFSFSNKSPLAMLSTYETLCIMLLLTIHFYFIIIF